jgi:predicted transcriptional regulator
VGSGLLLELNKDKISKYMISEKGIQFLAAYSSFEDFAQSFGLRL